jgi:transcriptional regulator with XRE-family HTH domain
VNKSVHSPEQVVLQDLLRDLREKAGLRQEDLAARLGRPQPFVSRYEIGTKMLDLPELRQICAGLGTSLPDLVAMYEKALREAGLV